MNRVGKNDREKFRIELQTDFRGVDREIIKHLQTSNVF